MFEDCQIQHRGTFFKRENSGIGGALSDISF
jgi:hypothetical protein